MAQEKTRATTGGMLEGRCEAKWIKVSNTEWDDQLPLELIQEIYVVARCADAKELSPSMNEQAIRDRPVGVRQNRNGRYLVFTGVATYAIAKKILNPDTKILCLHWKDVKASDVRVNACRDALSQNLVHAMPMNELGPGHLMQIYKAAKNNLDKDEIKEIPEIKSVKNLAGIVGTHENTLHTAGKAMKKGDVKFKNYDLRVNGDVNVDE